MDSKEERTQRLARAKRRLKEINSVVKLLILLGIIIGIPVYIYFFQHQIIDTFSSLESTNAYFEAHKTGNIFIILGLQIVQIMISVIPGQWIQFGAGYIYGLVIGIILSVIGAVIGTTVAYYLARFLGHDAVTLFFKEETIENYTEMLNSKKGVTIVFLIYLIPGLPKDLCCYAAGLSDMKLRPFLLISTVGRLPAMTGSILIGVLTRLGYYNAALIVLAIAGALLILCIIFRKKLLAKVNDAYDRVRELE
ncbi:MAG: TVP38/TMEM64 family protein [Anaerovoracaceae bacterium]|jgi:uncharacterized membrane protein YdjX (TVP38/TMEM64 family)